MLPTIYGVILGTMLGLLASGVLYSYDRFKDRHAWGKRMVPPELHGHRRDLPDQAKALAFATLYKFCSDSSSPHFLTEEDRERVYRIVRSFVSENRDKLGEMTLGPAVFIAGEEELTKRAVDQAATLFLQV